MRAQLLYYLFPLLNWQICHHKKISPATTTASHMAIAEKIDFVTQIQPILVKNCSPCHFTGGKMYERMPFDKDTTIINHEAGILKRIKNEENILIKNFIQQYKNGSSTDKPH
ncbi:MAG TPA: hypothetical protein VI548_12925 [Chitinophagaceae bacterium]|nr:hypothetical protein [Chitinophagaceae bacterium]